MKKRLIALCVGTLALLFLLPVVLTFASSFMGEAELNQAYSGASAQLRVIPSRATLDGYFELLFVGGKYLTMFWQSVLIAVSISAGSVLISLVVGFVFAKAPMRGSRALRFAYTFMMMMPFQVTLLPNYMMIRQMGLYNTQWALILPGLFAPLGVFLVSQFMKSIPDELLEAASLETNSILQMAFYIIIPLSRPALIAAFLLTFAEAWNMVEQPLIMIEDAWKMPLSLALNRTETDQLLVVFSGAVLFLTPVLFLYRIFGNDLIRGIGISESELK